MPEEQNPEENKTEEAKPEPKQNGVTLEKLDARLRAVEEVLKKEQKL